MIHLKTAGLNQIKQIAEETYPHECCGVMVGFVEDGVKTVTEVIPAENQRTDSLANRYLITAEFLYSVEQELKKCEKIAIGFFHSHPDVPARPSSYDLEHAWPWYSYLIVSVCKGQTEDVYNWKLKDDRSSFDLEEIKFF